MEWAGKDCTAALDQAGSKKTPTSRRFCPKKGLIAEFFPYQALSVLGQTNERMHTRIL